MVDVNNNLPKFYIVADTKLNPQTFERFLDESGKSSIIQNWNELNKSDNVSPLEQQIELTGRSYGILGKEEINNEEYLKKVIGSPSLQYLFDHASITVFFNDVSLNFLMLLLRLKIDNLSFINEKLTLEDIGFWLPSILDIKENKEFALEFAGGYSKVAQTMDKLLKDFNYEALKQENEFHAELVRQIVTRLAPISTQINVGLTCSVRGWRNMILMGSNFSSDEELRYVFLHLAKDLKKRYYGAFQDLKLRSDQGALLGLDTLRNAGVWTKHEIVSDIN